MEDQSPNIAVILMANCLCNLFLRFPTYVITIHERHRQTDRQQTDRQTCNTDAHSASCGKKDKQLLERVQHRFTRMLPGLKCLEYEDRLKVLGIWSLEERRNRADLLEVFKMKSGFSAVPFSTLFEIDSQQRTRGHTWKISHQTSQ